MFFRARQGLNWHETISSTKASGEVFAWLDAAMLALGFERQFGPSEMLYRRDDQEVRLDLRPSAAGTMATFWGNGRPLSAEERMALELAARSRLSASECPGFVAPIQPWLTPDQVVSPYPRLPARRRGWRRLLGRKDRVISVNRAPAIYETRFWPDNGVEVALCRLRAMAHFHDWREVPGSENELRFVRGQPAVAGDDTGVFWLPALLRVKVDPNIREVSIRLAIWGATWAPQEGGPKTEVLALRAYMKAGIRPDGLVRAVGRHRGATVSKLQMILIGIFVIAGVILSLNVGFYDWRESFFALIYALFPAALVRLFSKLAYPVTGSIEPQPLRPDEFTPEGAPSPVEAPDWARASFQHFSNPDSLMRVKSVS